MTSVAPKSRPRLSSRRDAVLREMGLGPIWRLRAPRANAHDVHADDQTDDPQAHDGMLRSETVPTESIPAMHGAPMNDAAQAAPALAPTPAHHASASTRPRDTHKPAAAIPPVERAQPARSRASAPTLPTADPARVAHIATLDWTALEADIATCRACVLCEQRKQAVPGVGDQQAEWMFVGEGPGSEEDRRGEPFVGPAGGLLDNMLAALGLNRRENVYLANAVKCRAPHNRTPEPAEVGTCLPYLERQIELVKPRLLIALGRPAALALLKTDVSISAARGLRFDYKGIPVVVTYHPAYLLRNPQDKGKAWADLCFARRLMAEQVAEQPPQA